MPETILWKEAMAKPEAVPEWDGYYGVYFPSSDEIALNFKLIWQRTKGYSSDTFIELVAEVAANEALHSLGMAHDGIYRGLDHFYHWAVNPLKFTKHADELMRVEKGWSRC